MIRRSGPRVVPEWEEEDKKLTEDIGCCDIEIGFERTYGDVTADLSSDHQRSSRFLVRLSYIHCVPCILAQPSWRLVPTVVPFAS